MAIDELGDLRLLGAIDALDQGDAEVAEVDAPDLHAALGVAGTHIVDAVDQDATFDFDVEPGPLLDRAGGAGVGDVIDLLDE
ncbi:MAG: hypothetical protein ACXV6M_10220 [Ilumatobacteraceae bacterium]